MDAEVDHYLVLGLPSGEEGAKLSEKEISKAFKATALELHPDKRPDDPDAHSNFQRLTTSYEILKDEKRRRAFDGRLKAKQEQLQRQTRLDSKRRKMVDDLEKREQAAGFAPDPSAVAEQEEERTARKLKEEIAAIRAMHSNKGAAVPPSKKTNGSSRKEGIDRSGIGLDKEKVLKVTWEKVGVNYNPERLKELFSKFGKVEDVVIRSSKKRGSALVVMGSKDAVVAAVGTVCGDLSNPLLVVPLQPTVPSGFISFQKPVEEDNLDNLVGAGYREFETSVLKKLREKAAQNKK